MYDQYSQINRNSIIIEFSILAGYLSKDRRNLYGYLKFAYIRLQVFQLN